MRLWPRLSNCCFLLICMVAFASPIWSREMALAVCRECGKEVSSEAAICPHCGVSPPAMPQQVIDGQNTARRWAANIKSVFSLLSGLGMVSCTLRVFHSAPDAPRTSPGIDSRTGRAKLDLARSLWVIAGANVCPTNDELDAARQHVPNNCVRLPTDMMVSER